jgi:hypothetical protein
MLRIYCRYPSYSIFNRETCYQFRAACCTRTRPAASFLRSRPEWGSLLTDTPAPAGPPSSSLWKVETPGEMRFEDWLGQRQIRFRTRWSPRAGIYRKRGSRGHVTERECSRGGILWETNLPHLTSIARIRSAR